MSRLYTSLVHAKLELNGGELRPMTPVPEKFHDIIDPAFTIGQGALREEVGRGLQCPVRGCGEWFHALKKHMDVKHADVGGSRRIKRILSIPATAKLVSMESRQRSARGRTGNSLVRHHITPESYKKAKRTRARNCRTTGMRNLRNACEQQVAHRLLDLQSQIGRSPSSTEARLLDPGLVDACIAIYGTWDSAKVVVGMELIKAGSGPTYDRADILPLFRVYYQLTGILPSLRQMEKLQLSWLLPTPPTIRKHFPGKSWPEIMDWMAWKLGVTDGRYGKPKYAKVPDLTAASLVEAGES